MNINHKNRMLYGSILLVLLVILYYYYTRIYEGLGPLPNPKTTILKPTPPVITTPTKVPTTAATTPATTSETTVPTTTVPTTTVPTTTVPTTNASTVLKPTTTTTTTKNEIDSANQVKQIKKSYLKFYQSLTDADKVEIKGMFNHLVENVIKDEYPQIT